MRAAPALLLVLLAACGSAEATAPGKVGVEVGAQDVAVSPTQFCLDGEGQRYDTEAPFIEVSPDASISLTVPDSVAERGWSVQVFDNALVERLGTVDVEAGTTTYDGINSSDVVPPAFYLVVVEDKGGDCGEFSGAWPIGFIRAGGDLGGTPSPEPQPQG